jgi:hypothetical protein
MDGLGLIVAAVFLIVLFAIQILTDRSGEGRSGLRVRLFRKRIREKRQLERAERKARRASGTTRPAPAPPEPAPPPPVPVLPPPPPITPPTPDIPPPAAPPPDPPDLVDLFEDEETPESPSPPPEPLPPRAVPEEPLAATEPLGAVDVAEALFARGASGSEREALFEERFRDRSVSWSGDLLRLETYRSDATFEGGPGVRAVLVVHTITGDTGGTREVRAIVQLPAGEEDLRSRRGETIAFRGRLVKHDGFLRDLYVADGAIVD